MNVTLYTDASFSHDLKAGGWAAWYRTSDVSGLVGGPLRPGIAATASPSACELAAIANAVTVVQRRGIIHPGDRLIVVTDSTVAIGAITTGELQSPAQNVVVRRIWEVVRSAKVALVLRHVKAHQSTPGCRRSYVNNLVDREAKHWRREAETRLGISCSAAPTSR